MKKTIFAIIMMLTAAVSAKAMSYEQARERALFLTDKMAYELDLTEEQYEAAYEVNLDYLMGVTTADECFGSYWTQRNLDLSYILLDWQYRSFCAVDYFYRPLYWDAGCWHFGIYSHYPVRTYLYFGRPAFVVSYYGGHSWRVNGGRSWYHGRSYVHHGGMRGGYDRGGYRNMSHGWRPGDGGNRGTHHGNGVTTNGHRRDHGNGGTTSGNRRDHGNNQAGTGNHGNRREHTSGLVNDGGSRRVSRSGSTMSSHESSTRSTVSRSGSEAPRQSYTPQRSFSGSNARSSSSFSGSRVSGGSNSERSSGGFSGSRSSGGFSGGHGGGHGGSHGSYGGGGRSSGRR